MKTRTATEAERLSLRARYAGMPAIVEAFDADRHHHGVIEAGEWVRLDTTAPTSTPRPVTPTAPTITKTATTTAPRPVVPTAPRILAPAELRAAAEREIDATLKEGTDRSAAFWSTLGQTAHERDADARDRAELRRLLVEERIVKMQAAQNATKVAPRTSASADSTDRASALWARL